jgi:L-threonylcarbamoyladenylate synthase
LRAGQLIAFPTETVYGLGADAGNRHALARLYTAKGRPANHPVIVHIGSLEELSHWVADVPEAARKLAQAFWPGPLTLVMRKSDRVLDQITGGQETVAIRVPRHPVALALLEAFKGGIAAPSANRFGRLSPTTAAAVVEEFGDEVAMVLDGGPCQVGIESTILDLSGKQPAVLRPGMILAAEIEKVLGAPVKAEGEAVRAPRAPGGLPKHYAPRARLCLVSCRELGKEVRALVADGKTPAVLAFCHPPEKWHHLPWICAPGDAVQYAHDLYGNLRHLDSRACDVIVVEAVPETAEWTPIGDRLSRAAGQAPGEGGQA